MNKSIKNIKDCYGCGVCSITCPQNIIELNLNSEGFYQPQITNIKNCTNCGLCSFVCSYTNNLNSATNNIKGFATFSKNKEIRYLSSSGGTGFEIAKALLRIGYQVCTVRYNKEKKNAEHYIAHNEKELHESIGSKYIPSYSINGFKEINKKLPFIVFGTPCQIASMRRLMSKKKLSDYILVDFFCHGTPSMLLWNKYLSEKQKVLGKIQSVSWRNKKFGWHDSWNMTFKTANETEISSRYTKGDLFYHFFLGNMCLNKACYKNCKFKNLNSAADIRLGDLWGEKYKNNPEGITGVLTFTQKGLETIESIKDLQLISESLEVITEGQLKKNLKAPYYRKITLVLLKSSLTLSVIKNILKVIRIIEILKYKIK